MAFLNKVLPVDVAPTMTVGAEFSTTIKRLRSGGEARNRRWSHPLRSFNIAYNVRSTDRVRSELVTFSYETAGAHIGFRARDWSDYTATDEDVAIGDDVTYWFRLNKRYGNYERRILKPAPGTISVDIDGAPLDPDRFAVDGDNGLLVFATPPATGSRITWSGEFHVPVRFEDDALTVQMLMHSKAAISDITLREVRLREIIDTAEIAEMRELLDALSKTELSALFDPLDIHVNTNWVNYG